LIFAKASSVRPQCNDSLKLHSQAKEREDTSHMARCVLMWIYCLRIDFFSDNVIISGHVCIMHNLGLIAGYMGGRISCWTFGAVPTYDATDVKRIWSRKAQRRLVPTGCCT
jgi:hypothetical protein